MSFFSNLFTTAVAGSLVFSFPVFVETAISTQEEVNDRTEIVSKDVQNRNTQILNEMVKDGMNLQHRQLMEEVSSHGVEFLYNDQDRCGEDMSDNFGVSGSLAGFYSSSRKVMLICNKGEFNHSDEYIVRHEVAHFIQDLNSGRLGDGKLVPYYDVTNSDFQAYLRNDVSQSDRDYALSYCEAGKFHVCEIEMDAEVQATSASADELKAQIKEFRF